MNKIPIQEGRCKGGLKDLEQVYRINYLPETTIKDIHYQDKIEIAITLEKDKLQEGAYRSYRFNQPVQLMSFVIGCIKAYFIFSKKRKVITPLNYRYHLNKFFENITNIIK